MEKRKFLYPHCVVNGTDSGIPWIRPNTSRIGKVIKKDGKTREGEGGEGGDRNLSDGQKIEELELTESLVREVYGTTSEFKIVLRIPIATESFF